MLHLQAMVEPPRQELFRRLNLAPEGIAALVSMRGELLSTLGGRPERRVIDVDLMHLFRSWFNGGFLLLQRIDWRTSASVLERLIQYEAVHQIDGWRDLRRRLEADRRCYAFFHPALPDDPLIFIEVALTRDMSATIQPLLSADSPVLPAASAKCAVFYSITNCQKGLRGVSFGHLLIKQVIEDLKRDFPRIRTFATLSPIPGFRKWVETTADSATGLLSSETLAYVTSLGSVSSAAAAKMSRERRDELTRACAYYLVHAKHGSTPIDPVARFHLANGARLERLNCLADTSENGMTGAFGFMANYVYRLPELDRNHEIFANDHRVLSSQRIERLARQAVLVRPGQ
jgi:malonyl-CoA decarboxylase